jgi:hypothetical protein
MGVAERGDRDDGWKATPVLADVSQFVDVLDPAGGLEHQRLEARSNRRIQLQAECRRPGDQLLRVRDVGRGDLVDDVRRREAQHPLGADVENLDDALLIGGDAGEVGAVEDGVLQRASLDLFAAQLPSRCHEPNPAVVSV